MLWLGFAWDLQIAEFGSGFAELNSTLMIGSFMKFRVAEFLHSCFKNCVV